MTPEIEKLLERLQRDPSSKLFVPLAEEYIKCGMLDEAMAVLKEGLRVHPGYLTAHVSLGKIYLQKNKIEEAKGEFESVVKLNPDNLLAHRKLAKIYKDEGNLKNSRISCEVVLAQSPMDKEIGALLEEMAEAERRSRPAESPMSSPSGTESDFSALGEGAIPEGGASSEEAPSPTGMEPGEVSQDEEAAQGLLSATLADLYVDQGHVEKGMEIYQRILEKFPSDERVRGKLEAARKRLEDPSSQPASPAAASGNVDPKREEKIRRLKSWLDSIKKGEER